MMSLHRVSFVFLAAILVLALGVAVVAAQDGSLDLGADPSFGSITLSTGFEPDPYITTLVSGGATDVSQLDLGDDCAGFAATSPDFRLNLDTSMPQLRIFFISEGDATLIVNDPSGAWLCNDDSVGTTPMLELTDAEAGVYDIWVGSFSDTDFLPGYLMVTELDSTPGAIQSELLTGALLAATSAPMAAGTGELDPNAEPTFFTVELDRDFLPDPYSIEIFPGGATDASTLGLGTECVGSTATAPDVSVVLTEDFPLLRMFVVSEEDTSLIVRAPDGGFFCNDDSSGSINPMLDLTDAPAGEYDVWVGNVFSEDVTQGTLYLSELTTSTPDTVGS
jgi:hypothetical protein